MSFGILYFFLMTAIQWYYVTTNRDIYRRSLPPRDSRFRHQCCGGNHYAGPTDFHQRSYSDRRFNNNLSFKYRHEYQIPSSNHHHHHHHYEDNNNNYYYNRPNRLNYNDYKSPHSKFSYERDYYSSRYSTPSEPGTKYMQKRTGFVFRDPPNNIKDDRYRPYVSDSDFQDHKHYENYNGLINFRNKNHNHAYYEQPDDRYRQKYRPGLLGIAIGKSGTAITTDPNGYKHVIHNLPPWTEVNGSKDKGFFPSNVDARGGIEYPGSHKFSTEFHDHHHHMFKDVPVFKGGSGITYDNDSHFVSAHKYSKHGNRNQEAGPTRDISDILHHSIEIEKPHDTTPLITNKFRPSHPFHRYSEPDPLFHPNGSPLQTYSPIESTKSPTTPSSKPSIITKTKTTPIPSPEKLPKYPDSINAQLPPPSHDIDIRVPYVAATAITEHTPSEHFTAVTQTSDATHKKPLVQVLPTESSIHSSTASDVLSTLIQNQSSSKGGNNVFLPTSSDEEMSTYSSFAEISLYTTQISQTGNNFSGDHFLPTLITEKSNVSMYQTTESQISSETDSSYNTTLEPTFYSHDFSNFTQKSEPSQTSLSSTNDTDKRRNETESVTVIQKLQQSFNNTDIPIPDLRFGDTELNTDINTMITAVAETEQVSTEAEISDLNSSLKLSDENTRERKESTTKALGEEDMMDTIPDESKLNVNNIVTKPVPSLFNHLHTLVNHARSLNYLHYDSITTVPPEDENERQ